MWVGGALRWQTLSLSVDPNIRELVILVRTPLEEISSLDTVKLLTTAMVDMNRCIPEESKRNCTLTEIKVAKRNISNFIYNDDYFFRRALEKLRHRFAKRKLYLFFVFIKSKFVDQEGKLDARALHYHIWSPKGKGTCIGFTALQVELEKTNLKRVQ